MTILYINTGTSANAGNGDVLRTAFWKVNLNFSEIQSILNGGGGNGSIIQSSTPPVTTSTSTLWYDTVGGRSYVYYDQTWVDASPTADPVDLSAVHTDIVPITDNTYSLGSPSNQWKHIFVSTGSIYLGDVKLSTDNGQLQIQTVNYSYNTSTGQITTETVTSAYAAPTTVPSFTVTDTLQVGTIVFSSDGSSQTTAGGAGTLSIKPDIVSYGVGTYYSPSNLGFTVVNNLNEDDMVHTISLPFTMNFLGNTCTEVKLVSNSYITFGPTVIEPYYFTLGPGKPNVPAIFVGARDNSLQKYYYGTATGTNVFVIGYAGSADTGGSTTTQTVLWEAQFSYVDGVADTVSITMGDTSPNFPGGVWGVSNGAEWVDMINPLPWYGVVGGEGDFYRTATVSPGANINNGTVAFTGPGVNIINSSSVTYININPFDNIISLGLDNDNSQSVISSVYYGLKLTTAEEGNAIDISPLGNLNLHAGNKSLNQPGNGFNTNINGGDGVASDTTDYNGGSVYLRGGNAANAGTPGSVVVTSNSKNWEFHPSGSLHLSTSTFTGAQESDTFVVPTLALGTNDKSVGITNAVSTNANRGGYAIVIQGQRGFGDWGTTGWGGDGSSILINAGVGGESSTNDQGGEGGNIEIHGGVGQNGRDGGDLNLIAGNARWSGGTNNVTGGHVWLTAGSALSGEGVAANKGYGGDIRIYAGIGNTVSGNINFYTSNNNSSPNLQWALTSNGSTVYPSGLAVVPISVFYPGAPFSGTIVSQTTGSMLQIVAQGTDGSAAIGWAENPSLGGKVAAINFNSVANSVNVTAGSYTGTLYYWTFQDNGITAIPGEISSAAGTGNVVINASNGTTSTWTFGGDGNLTLPIGGGIKSTTNHYSSTASGTIINATVISTGSSKVFLEPGSGISASYQIGDGLYDGQEIKFYPSLVAGISQFDVQSIYVFVSKIYNIGTTSTSLPWYPFGTYFNGATTTPSLTWDGVNQCWILNPWNWD
jgi:hypothetical protein